MRESKSQGMAATDNQLIYGAIYLSLLTTFTIPRHKIQIILIKIILSYLGTHLFSPDHDFPCRGLHISGGELLVDVSAVVVRESVLQTPGSPGFRKQEKRDFPHCIFLKIIKANLTFNTVVSRFCIIFWALTHQFSMLMMHRTLESNKKWEKYYFWGNGVFNYYSRT